MRAWTKMHGTSVRQRNVEQDNTIDMVGTLPLNVRIYNRNGLESSQFEFTVKRRARVPSESNEPANSNEDVNLPPESPNIEVCSFSVGDTHSEGRSALKAKVDRSA